MEVVQRFCQRGMFLIWVFLPVGAKILRRKRCRHGRAYGGRRGRRYGLHVRRQLVGPGPVAGAKNISSLRMSTLVRVPLLIPDSPPASGQRKLEFGRMSLSHSRRASDSLQDGPSPSLSAWDGAHGVDGPS